MPRNGPYWSFTEIELLLENVDKPVNELCGLFPDRTKKSIERKIEKLRKSGKIGYKYPAYETKEPVSRDSWNDGWGK